MPWSQSQRAGLTSFRSRPPWLVVVLSRWPAPGRCKRRLARSIHPVAAATIQSRLLVHVLSLTQPLVREGLAHRRLAVTGAGLKAWRRWLAPLGYSTRGTSLGRQGGGNLGCRMARQVRWGLARHYRGVVLLGSDCLGLETGDLRQALHLLSVGEKPLVLGPARDGGYWLMGQRCFDAGLFSDVPWGGPAVGDLTRKRACASGFQVHTLCSRTDVDRLEDLQPWLAVLNRNGITSELPAAIDLNSTYAVGRCTSAVDPGW
ncbi:MAG: glycosyltransferase [Synechococcus sp. SB0678_bin_12]|nr:glycosyltransferase [Synechococcus sp. SB0678_bin_12]MYJ60031.1 glycosyltransferase [Synechococcus sp. SB0672_bin_6]